MASLAEAARTAAAPAPATRQESLGDYVVLRELHRSEVGAVFLARRRADGVGVVLKERRASELGRERPLDNEAALYARLAHPNVLRCEGHFFDGPHHSLFLVLELCRGGDLWSLLERQRRRRSYVPEPRVWGMLAQLADALRYLHAAGVVHRDVKARNVLVDAAGDLRLGDLGVSRAAASERELLHTVYGTPLYMSPELCEGRPYWSASDMWSLGVMVYELCALQPPFRGASLLAVARRIVDGVYAPLPSHYSRELEHVVAWLLQRDATRRPTAEALVRWIQQARAEGRIATVDSGPALGCAGFELMSEDGSPATSQLADAKAAEAKSEAPPRPQTAPAVARPLLAARQLEVEVGRLRQQLRLASLVQSWRPDGEAKVQALRAQLSALERRLALWQPEAAKQPPAAGEADKRAADLAASLPPKQAPPVSSSTAAGAPRPPTPELAPSRALHPQPQQAHRPEDHVANLLQPLAPHSPAPRPLFRGAAAEAPAAPLWARIALPEPRVVRPVRQQPQPPQPQPQRPRTALPPRPATSCGFRLFNPILGQWEQR